jgi:Mg/Co/Ni transporter MgtE
VSAGHRERRLARLEDRDAAALRRVLLNLPQEARAERLGAMPDAAADAFYLGLSDAEVDRLWSELPEDSRVEVAELSDAQLAELAAGRWPAELRVPGGG